MNLAVPFSRLAVLMPGRKARVHAVRVVLIGAGFAALLVSGFHHRRDLAEFLKAAASRPAFVTGAGQAGETEVLRPHDPRSAFPAAQVGLMLFASYNTDFCRRVLFDNRTGKSYDAGQGYCGLQPEAPAEHLGTERILAMGKAFRR